MLSNSEENYLKALLHLTLERGQAETGTNELAASLEIKPAAVSLMLKKLKEKNLVLYKKYGGISLTSVGKKAAIEVIRKHRLWETFLCEKLDFSWSEVHTVAEQLEHIQSKKLIDELDKFLGFPKVDPHGEPIPSAKGELDFRSKITLSEAEIKKSYIVLGVKDDSSEFLEYVDKMECKIGTVIKILSVQPFDESLEVVMGNKKKMVTKKFAQSIFVKKKKA
ncbi:MAG: metal-dependent transcriptional regulator [Flavobacteriales bacterium]